LPPPQVPPQRRALLLEESLVAKAAEVEQLRVQLAERQARSLQHSRVEAELRVQLRKGAALAAELEGRVHELEGRCTELTERVSDLQKQVVERTAAAARARSELERYRQSVEQKLSEATMPARFDDLTKLRGVGPRFQLALHAAGVLTYAQIAAWTDADIEAVASRLKIPSGRIRRDGWVASARQLSASSVLS
jgi:predicted flap endonuclease-1-like 5' DNA nuclease